MFRTVRKPLTPYERSADMGGLDPSGGLTLNDPLAKDGVSRIAHRGYCYPLYRSQQGLAILTQVPTNHLVS
jgi:hypothetical protein